MQDARCMMHDTVHDARRTYWYTRNLKFEMSSISSSEKSGFIAFPVNTFQMKHHQNIGIISSLLQAFSS